MVRTTPRPADRRPWAGMTGLLTACVVVGIGTTRGLDPDVILFRAFGAGVALTVLTAIFRVIVTRILRSE